MSKWTIRKTLMALTGVVVILCGGLSAQVPGSCANASALLAETEMEVLVGGCGDESHYLRDWECGGPAHGCDGVGEGNYCNSQNPNYPCSGTAVIPEEVQACNATSGTAHCDDGDPEYCGQTNNCECDDPTYNCVSYYFGTSGWYNPYLPWTGDDEEEEG